MMLRMSPYYLLTVFTLALFCVTNPAFAADDEVMEGLSEEQKEASESVQDRLAKFTQDFDESSEKHFYALYGSYNLIKVVEDVRSQVEEAVNKCGEANPDMKTALDTRYNEWNGAISPILEDANANVENMIAAQDYTKPRNIEKFLKFVDKKREVRDDEVKKYPVTSPEACEFLRKNMDNTQENLTKLLKSTLVSLPNALINSGIESEPEAEIEDDAEEAAETDAQDAQ